MITARGLSFSYSGRSPAIDGVDLTIEDCSLIGIVGPNGSGKSTLLRLLSGALAPQKGVVLLDGRPIRGFGAKEVARRISFLGQGVEYGFDYTAREIVAMGRYARTGFLEWGGPVHRKAVEGALARAGAASLSDRLYSQLSGGERQRVNIARCLAQDAPTLLLDEPTHDLDIKAASELSDLVRGLNSEKGMTIVAVMHDLNLALRTFDEIVLMRGGKVIARGPPDASLTEGNLERCFGIPLVVDLERGTVALHR